MKFLREVTVEYTFFAYTETADDAVELAEEALKDIDVRSYTCAREVKFKDIHISSDWDRDCLVYGPEEDTTLGSVLDKLPARGRI